MECLYGELNSSCGLLDGCRCPCAIVVKPSSRIVFGSIQWYCIIPSRNHMEILGSNFWIPSNTPNTVKFWVLWIELVSIPNTVKHPRQLLATIWVPHPIPLDTFGNPEYSNYLLFKHILQWTWSRQKMETIYSRASIVFIWTNPAKIQIYRQLLLATQITVFDGIWIANIKYRQILYSIWELQ